MPPSDNPFAPPQSTFDPDPDPPVDQATILLRWKTLESYRFLHGRTPGVGTLAKLGGPRLLVSALIHLGGVAILFSLGQEHFAVVLIGFFLGSWLQWLGHTRMIVRVWPLIDSIIDWDRVERLHARGRDALGDPRP